MGAIDALLCVKLDSERMHQVVLSALLCKSRLLERLGIPGTPEGQFDWEPQRGLYDIRIPMKNQGPLLVEVKVDSGLYRRQITRQLEGLREQASHEQVPQLLYLVLGATRFTTNKADLESVVSDVDSSMLVGRHVHYRDVDDLIKALAELCDVRNSKDGQDVCDIAKGYRTALSRIVRKGEGYSTKHNWDWQNHLRVFGDCRRRAPRQGCGLQYTPNPAGGFLEYYFHKTPSTRRDDVKAYMRFEFVHKDGGPDRFALLLRIVVADKGSRGTIRNAFHAAAVKAGEHLGIGMIRPSRFGLGETMTVAQFPEAFDIREMRTPTGTEMDWDKIRDCCDKAEEVVKEACRIFDEQSL